MSHNCVTSSTNVHNHTTVSDSHCCHHGSSSCSPSIFMDAGLGVRMVNPAYASYNTDSWINNNNSYWRDQQEFDQEMAMRQYKDQRANSWATKGAIAGAAIGSCVAFPIGTVVGGVIGGVVGFFGGLFS
ncbi:hypothetical protein IJC60_06560 [bacterium]|nr:hypothetical protein [bacterium]